MPGQAAHEIWSVSTTSQHATHVPYRYDSVTGGRGNEKRICRQEARIKKPISVRGGSRGLGESSAAGTFAENHPPVSTC
jgi:hypothetical protein